MRSRANISKQQYCLEQLLLRGRIEKAIDFLEDLVCRDLVFGKLRNEIIVLKANHVFLSEQRRVGAISGRKFYRCQTQIMYQILSIKDDLSIK